MLRDIVHDARSALKNGRLRRQARLQGGAPSLCLCVKQILHAFSVKATPATDGFPLRRFGVMGAHPNIRAPRG
ncbi:hypothetical protein ICN83_15100 [Sphingopyxis granuli]|nr:hypothetical protein ICN83_15100 [Sphingopyxis granuli]